jgi:homoserine kinase
MNLSLFSIQRNEFKFENQEWKYKFDKLISISYDCAALGLTKMKPETAKVYAPASISNIGSGFDVLGLAIDRPGDLVVAQRRIESGLEFSVNAKRHDVPADPRENVAAHVAWLMLDEFKPPFGVRMMLQKGVPISSGLGGSAASSVAAAVAINTLLPKPLAKRDLLRFALEGERKACCTAHADNVAPSLLGGVCLIRSYDPLDVISIPIRNAIVWVVAHPHLIIRTEDARSILPDMISLKTGIRQWGNVAGLMLGLIKGNAELIGKCVEDRIAEPFRAHLVAGFYDVRQAALFAGALGCTLSGSGPSMFAVATSTQAAKRIGFAMKKAFARLAKVSCDIYISRVNMKGATILQSKTW